MRLCCYRRHLWYAQLQRPGRLQATTAWLQLVLQATSDGPSAPSSAGAEQRVDVQELVWGEQRLPAWCRAGGYDWVLASDVCYDSERFQPLLDSILQLAALSPETKVGTPHTPAIQ
jgi:Lysine methyltransferase